MTPPEKIGYRLSLESGTLPPGLTLPARRDRARRAERPAAAVLVRPRRPAAVRLHDSHRRRRSRGQRKPTPVHADRGRTGGARRLRGRTRPRFTPRPRRDRGAGRRAGDPSPASPRLARPPRGIAPDVNMAVAGDRARGGDSDGRRHYADRSCATPDLRFLRRRPRRGSGRGARRRAAPPIVREEQQLLDVVLRKLDGGTPRKARIQVDDASALIELRDALAEAKPEDQGSILEQMHRIEALSQPARQGRHAAGRSQVALLRAPAAGGERQAPRRADRRAQLRGTGRRRADRRLAQRPGVAPVLSLRRGRRLRGAPGRQAGRGRGARAPHGRDRRRRAAAGRRPAGDVSRATCAPGQWREVATRQARLQIARDGSARRGRARAAKRARRRCRRRRCRRRVARQARASTTPATRRPDRHLPAIAALIDPRQFELITQPSSGLIAIQGSAGSGKTTIGLHRIAYLAFADPRRFRPEKHAGDRLPARAGRLRVARVAVAGRRGRAGDDVRRAGPMPRGARRCPRSRPGSPTTRRRWSCAPRRTARCCASSTIARRRWRPGAARCMETELGGQGRRRGRAGVLGRRPAAPSTRASPRWRSGCATATLDPGDAQRAGERRPHAARAHPRRDRRVGGAVHRSRGAGRRVRAPRARAVLVGPARRHPPLVRRARSPAHGRTRRQRRRDVRARRRGRRPAAAHPPAPARPPPRTAARACSPTST